MSIKLYTSDKQSPNTWKILAAAKLNGVTLATEDADTKSSDFQKKNPIGKLPVLETEEGNIFGANAIARYVAKQGSNKLFGSNAFEAAAVEQWIDYAVTDIDLPAAVWVYPILGLIPNNATATQKAKGDIRKTLENLNKHLLTRTFLVGQRLTLADVVVALSLVKLYELVLDAPFRKGFVNTNRWFMTVVNQPEVKAVVGNVTMAEKMQAAKEAPAEEKKVEEKPKKEEKPKEKKEDKPKKKEAEEEEEDFEAAEKKSKGPNPLDLLPPSKFVLDDWKRYYSNEDTRSKAIPYFWENLDKEGYSIYFGDYKYNAELEKLFMTCNLVGGFVQRLDKLRKYGFGSIVILGDEANGMKIEVCFLFRGQDVPAEMTDCDDYEVYNWTKADLNDPATQERVNQFWAWDMPKFNQGKIFK